MRTARKNAAIWEVRWYHSFQPDRGCDGRNARAPCLLARGRPVRVLSRLVIPNHGGLLLDLYCAFLEERTKSVPCCYSSCRAQRGCVSLTPVSTPRSPRISLLVGCSERLLFLLILSYPHTTAHCWSSGRIHRCHRWGPRSIRGRCNTFSLIFFFFLALIVLWWCQNVKFLKFHWNPNRQDRNQAWLSFRCNTIAK